MNDFERQHMSHLQEIFKNDERMEITYRPDGRFEFTPNPDTCLTVVKDLKILKLPPHQTQAEFLKTDFNRGYDDTHFEITKEVVRGHRLTDRRRGVDIILGLDERTNHILGMPFEVIDEQGKQIEVLRSENLALKEKFEKTEKEADESLELLEECITMGWWDRLKWAIKDLVRTIM